MIKAPNRASCSAGAWLVALLAMASGCQPSKLRECQTLNGAIASASVAALERTSWHSFKADITTKASAAVGKVELRDPGLQAIRNDYQEQLKGVVTAGNPLPPRAAFNDETRKIIDRLNLQCSGAR